MVELQTLITLLPLLSLASTATANRHPTALGRRGLTTYCNPLFGGCNDQWPFSPITSGNHFISRPFLRHPTPPLLLPSPPSVVVPSPPPPVFNNPSFTTPSDDMNSNPSFSPLVASPPPPGDTIDPPVLPELPPADGGVTAAPPFLALSFSPPVNVLPPIAGKDQPEVFMSPPQENWPRVFNVPPPPLVAIDSRLPEDAGEVTSQQLEGGVMPPPVAEDAASELQVPPVVESPPAA